MEIIFTTDLSYYNEDWECWVDKAVSLVESCGMYAVIYAENDTNYENVETFSIEHAYSYDKAVTIYKNLGGEV